VRKRLSRKERIFINRSVWKIVLVASPQRSFAERRFNREPA